ncbi:hypothetical protein WA026_014257 [Henosepilachna vigintioctopunctata]|uniref:Uncharacterized protein n=1 Tax=Henosepilachna vigintioctopunctata TaxID=420089 RepID=A0AAW1TUM4_9CUCU
MSAPGENVRNHMNSVNGCEFQDALSENSSTNLEVQLHIVGLENEVKIAKIMLESATEKLEFQQNARTNRQSGSVSANYASVLDTETKKDKKVSVFGSAKSKAESPTKFFGADRFAWVHLGRAALKTSEEALMNRLTQKFRGKK